MKRTIFLTLALALLASSGFAWNYHYGALDGTNPFDRNQNSSGFINDVAFVYPGGVGALPSPGTLGEGGEKMDLEGLRVKEDNDYVYVALANSFGFESYSTGWNQAYNIGDLFIGVDGSQNGFAIDIVDAMANNSGSTGFFSVGSYNGIANLPGTYFGYPDVTTAAGAFELAQGSKLGDVDFFLGYDRDYETDPMTNFEAQTYVWEFRIDKSLLGNFKKLDFHVTMACGNDFMNESYEAIPEPTTLLLFGMGVLGAAAIRRRRK